VQGMTSHPSTHTSRPVLEEPAAWPSIARALSPALQFSLPLSQHLSRSLSHALPPTCSLARFARALSHELATWHSLSCALGLFAADISGIHTVWPDIHQHVQRVAVMSAPSSCYRPHRTPQSPAPMKAWPNVPWAPRNGTCGPSGTLKVIISVTCARTGRKKNAKKAKKDSNQLASTWRGFQVPRQINRALARSAPACCPPLPPQRRQ